MKKYLIFGSVIFSCLLLAGCSISSNKSSSGNDQLKNTVGSSTANTESTTTASSTKEEKVLVTSAVTNDWKWYRNNHYGFELIFPESWKDFKAIGHLLATSKSIYFGFAKPALGSPVVFFNGIFNVSVFDKQKWAEVKNEAGTPTYLGENQKYVFAWAPIDFASDDVMSARSKEVSEIIKSFNAFDMMVGKKYEDSISNYSYVCPTKFTLAKKSDFDGSVEVSECARNYSKTSSELSNGVSLSVQFVPSNLSDTFKSGNELLSVKKVDAVKKSAGAKTYNRNHFSGWVSVVPNKGGSINYIARRDTTGGYYEIKATIALRSKATSKEVIDRQAIVDKVFESFLIIK